MTMDEARDTIKARTRRYAKRQLSWLRRDGRARWLDYDKLSEDDALELLLSEVRGT
jgi:tRNA dimethylallyltransferase